MYDNYNYPAGADTPDAPWNQVELKDIYGDDANDRIDEEISDHDGMFIDWACENGYLSEDFTDADVDRIARDGGIRDEYRDYRFDDMVETLAEEAADANDYDYERYMDMHDD